MSDVGVAPPPSAPQAAPAQSEVVVNQHPQTQPAPIGQQAPPRPPEDMKSADHRRESIRRAVDRAYERSGQDKPAPGRQRQEPPQAEARQARMGDNNPPEETRPEKIDLRKRPADQPRDNGRFAPRQPAEHGAPPQRADNRADNQDVSRDARRAPRLPPHAPYAEPLPRMHERAKAEWAHTPESVRGDVYRMRDEYGKAFQKYKADHDEMQAIRSYQKMASEHGTTLKRALDNYTGMEQKLRSDPIGGFDQITNNLNLRAADGTRLTFRDVCWHYLNQTPEQHKLVQSENTQTALTHQIGKLHQMVNTLAQGQQRAQYEQTFGRTRAQLDQYADSHPRFDELGDLIEQEIKLGFDLDTAYKRADRLRPATRAAQTRTDAPAAQTRTSDRSIRGAPASAPSSNGARRTGKPPERREAIANAIKRANGAL